MVKEAGSSRRRETAQDPAHTQFGILKIFSKLVFQSHAMKTVPAFLLVFIFYSMGHTQALFEQGYLVNLSGDSIPCLIKNQDLKKNPQRFEYKLTGESPVQTGDPHNTRAFGIGREVKFIMQEVDVDASSDEIEDLDLERAPRFSREKVFLRVLLEGKGSLYELDRRHNVRYYIMNGQGLIEPLVYKAFQVPGKGVAYNFTYRSQLNREMACGSSAKSIQDLKYERTSLVKYVKDYNVCAGGGFVEYEKQARPLKFSARVFTGINFYSALINHRKDPKTGLNVGAELEAILPVNKSKLSVFIAPAYQSFRSDPVEFSLVTAHLELSGLEVPLGFRYYSYLSPKNSLFLEGMFVYDLSFTNAIKFKEITVNENQDAFVYAFGAGFRSSRFTVQGRWYQTRKFTSVQLIPGQLGFEKISVFLGYRLF